MSDNSGGFWTCADCGDTIYAGTPHNCKLRTRAKIVEPIILARVFPCADECKKLREQVGQLQLGNAMSLQKIGELKDDYAALEQERDRLARIETLARKAVTEYLTPYGEAFAISDAMRALQSALEEKR